VSSRDGHGVRRSLVVVVALLLVGTSACIRSESGIVQSSGKPVSEKNLPPCPLGALQKAKGTVKVELWEAFVGKAKEEINALAKGFNASQDKVQVEVRSQGDNYDELLRKFQAGLASRQLPAIALIEDQNLRVIVDTGAVLPAESCQRADKSDFPVLPAVRNYYTIDDVFWPGYVDVSEPVLYYNVNHFKKAGLDPDNPPKTLDELEHTARTLKEKGVTDKPLALKMDSWFIESWINGAGATVVNKNNGRDGIANKATFDNPVTHQVYAWIKRMLDEGLAQPIPDTPGNIDQYLALAQQNSSMTIETSTAATTIKAFLSGDSSGVDTGGASGDLSGLVPSAGPFPGVKEPGKVRISGGAFYMTNTVPPEVQAGAWEFMRYMQSTDSQVSWHLVGSYLPTTQAAASDPRVIKFWDTDLAGKMLKTAYEQLLKVDPQKPGPSIGPYPQYDDAVRKSLESMAFDNSSPDDAVAGAQKAIQDALTQYIEDNAPN
jgi:sn-glycerol 3-phosphate transport system substrate-binding protein